MKLLGKIIAWRKETAANLKKTAAVCILVDQRKRALFVIAAT
jgi:hypothetical protein